MPTPIRVLLKFVPRKPFKCKREEVEKRFRLKVPPQKDPFPVGNWVIGFNFTSDGKTHHVLAKWTWSCSICTPQELVQWRTTTSLGKKYNEFFIDPVQDSKVKQWYKLTTRCILGMSSKNIRSDLSTTFAKTWRARNKPPFLFLPLRCSVDSVALVWPAPSYSVTQWLLKQLRDTSNSDAYSWTVGSVHHYARVNWKAYHHIKASGIRSTSSFQAVFIPAPLHSFSCKEKTVQQILSTNQIPVFIPIQAINSFGYSTKPSQLLPQRYRNFTSPNHGTHISEAVSWFLNLSRIFRLWGAATCCA